MRSVLLGPSLFFALLLLSATPTLAAPGRSQGSTPTAVPGLGEALRAECQAAYEQGDLPSAVDACTRALKAFRQEGDRAGEGAILVGLGWLFEQLQEYESALDNYEAALSILRQTGDRSGEAQAEGGSCRVRYALGDYEGVSEACGNAAAIFHALESPAEEATAYYVLGLALQKATTASGSESQRAGALEAYTKALPLYQAAGDRVGEAGILLGIGDLYTLAGDHQSALEHYLRALPIHQEIGNPSLTMVSLGCVATAYAAISDSQNALAYYEQALPLRREMGDRAGEASTLSGIGLAQKRLGRYQAALDTYAEALLVWQELGSRSWEAMVTSSMGDIYSVQFDYPRARSSYEQALSIYRAQQDRANEALTLHALAGVYFDLANYAQALALYGQALAIRQELGDRLGESRTLNNMALAYDSLSQYQEALALYQEALRIKQEIGDRAGQAAVLGNIAAIYGGLYDNQRALGTYGEALEIARQEGDRLGEMAALTGMGVVLRQDGRYDEAIEYHRQALAIAREIGDLRGEAAALGNLGVVYDELGEDGQALDMHRQALAIREQIGDEVGKATTQTLLGELLLESSEYADAESYLTKALGTWRSTGDRRSEATTLGDLAVLSDRQGQEERATDLALQAIDVLESIYSAIKTEDLQSTFIDGVSGYYQYAVRLLLAQGRPEEAFLLAERGRARAFLNLLGNQAVDAKGSEDASLVRREADLRAEMNAVERTLRGEQQPDDERAQLTPGDAAGELQGLRQAYAELLSTLQITNPEYASLVSVDPLALEEVQAMLREQAPDVTLLSYFVGAEQTVIFVVTGDEFHVAEVPVSADDLGQEVEGLLAEMKEAPLLPHAWRLRARALYAWLIAPVEQYLPSGSRGKAPRLGIIPFGQLHYLPFGLLHGDGTGAGSEPTLLQDRCTVFYAPSASSLRFILAGRQAESTGILAMANPDAPGAPHLAHAADEARAVAALYDASALLGPQATESRFRIDSVDAGIIHLAAHSNLQPDNPLFSAILLQPDDTDDGRLETHEIINLSLSATDLVVLSACQTHLGELSAGDELVGMERAFFRAGTPSLLTTLWPVDDEATSVLMQGFYTRLRAGVPKADALRQAQLETRKAYPEPYFWAGFVLVGDPGAGAPARTAAWWLWLLVAAAGLGLGALTVALTLRRRRFVPKPSRQ